MGQSYDFGLVGLGVMGRNFILNVADHGYSAYGLDMNPEQVSALQEEGKDVEVDGTRDAEKFVKSLKTPRKIMLLVPAGKVVDSVIGDLLPHLDQGDLIIDGGNSFFTDTDRRLEELQAKGIRFLGSGVSGGAKGARFGPSIMPGGSEEAYELIRPIFEAVAADVNGDPCVAYMGKGSAGNYVKMVHNGIEYGLMQLISESYDIMKKGMGLNNNEIREVFQQWNMGRLQSFLIEISTEIMGKEDDVTGGDLVDFILDKAKQKGTGKWTSQNAMDLGMAIPTIDMAVSMREISSLKDTRVELEARFPKSVSDQTTSIKALESALYFSFLMTYGQGLSMLTAASEEYEYGLDLETICRIWRGGCIIRAGILEDLRKVYSADPHLSTILLNESIADEVRDSERSMRDVVTYAMGKGIPCGCLSDSLNYFDAMTTGRLPLNLLQAQRDFFGSHTYERTDQVGIFHTEW